MPDAPNADLVPWPRPHRFEQDPRVTTDPYCGVERYPDENPGVVCGASPSYPLHDWFCGRCACVVSGAHGTHTDEPHLVDLVRELRQAVGLFDGAMPITPKQAWEEALAVVVELRRGRCHVCLLRERQPARIDGGGADG